MGYKTILAHRKQLAEKIAVYEALVASAKSVSGQMAKLEEAHKKVTAETERLAPVLTKMADDMSKLDTKDVKEFEDFRKSLLATVSGGSLRPLPTKPLEARVAYMYADFAAEELAVYQALVASAKSVSGPLAKLEAV